MDDGVGGSRGFKEMLLRLVLGSLHMLTLFPPQKTLSRGAPSPKDATRVLAESDQSGSHASVCECSQPLQEHRRA